MVTAIELPDDDRRRQGAQASCASYGITANGGQDQLKGRILRIAHCGYFGAFDILTSLSRAWRWRSPSSATRSSSAPASAPPSACSSRPASRGAHER